MSSKLKRVAEIIAETILRKKFQRFLLESRSENR